jgi:3-oxoadipate enol-lactonase
MRVGDIDVCFALEGPAQAPVVMLAHGILTSHRMWDGLAALLVPRWRVLRYDLRGHGGTSASEPPYTMKQLAGDAVGLLDALGLDRVHFIGSSLGGMIGQQLGAKFGERFRSLALANTTAVQGAAAAWEQRIAVAREQSVGPLVEPTLARWFTPGFAASDPAAVDRMRQLALATSVPGFIGCAAAVRDLDHAQLLGDIRVPTLVIAGELDGATPPAESRRLQESIPGAGLAILAAAHQAAAECPGAFAAVWQSFVQQPEPA